MGLHNADSGWRKADREKLITDSRNRIASPAARYNYLPMNALISVENVTYHYPNQQSQAGAALKGVSLQFHEGEFVVILGANGSGKTTLARHLNGLLEPTQGKVMVGRLDTRERANQGLIRQRVGMVFQHPEDQIVATTVEEDVAFGPENLGLRPQEIRQRVDAAIDAVGLEAHRRRSPHMLSSGQMQRLALAGVLAMRPRCVVFDEATTMLDPAGRRMALELMAELRSAGMAVLFVTHNMEEAALADRAIVLEAGTLAFDGSPRELFNRSGLNAWGLEPPPVTELARRLRRYFPMLPADLLGVTELLEHLPAPEKICPPFGLPEAVQPTVKNWVIEVENLGHTYMEGTPLAHVALHGIDFRVADGRAHGLVGVTGSGKSTLLQHLNGVLRPQSGTVRVGPHNLNDPALATREVARMAGLVMQNPESQFFEQYVGDEIAFGPRQIGIDESIKERVRRSMEQVGLDFEAFKDRLTYTLSGGEKRKAALASVLALKPQILLLDEPTAGLDPRSRKDILASLQKMVAGGLNLVLSSHQMEDVAALAADVTAFRKGRTAISGSAADIFWQFENLREIGLEPPVSAQAAARLRELGWPVPVGAITFDDLTARLDACLEVPA